MAQFEAHTHTHTREMQCEGGGGRVDRAPGSSDRESLYLSPLITKTPNNQRNNINNTKSYKTQHNANAFGCDSLRSSLQMML